MRHEIEDTLGRLRMAFEEHIEIVRQVAVALDNVGSQASQATNKQMATALWNYLFYKYGHSDGSSGRSVLFVHLTRQRLNSALKAITKAQRETTPFVNRCKQ